MRAASLALCLLAAGCAGTYGSPWSWDATQANRQNVAASAEEPADLVQGRGAPGGDGAIAAGAIERLRRDRPRTLPDVATSSAAGGGGGSPGGGSPPETAGAAVAASAGN